MRTTNTERRGKPQCVNSNLATPKNSDFQSCQERYRIAYLCDLTQDKEKDAFRVGGAWHAQTSTFALADIYTPKESNK